MRTIIVNGNDGRRALYSQTIEAYDEKRTVPLDGKFVRFKHDYEIDPHYKPRQLVNFKTNIAIPEIANQVKRVGPDPDFNYDLRAYEYEALSKEWQLWLLEFLRASVDDILPYGAFVRFYQRKPPEYPFASSSTFAEFTAGSLLAYWESIMARHVAMTDDRPPEDWHDEVTGRNPEKPPFSYMCKGFGGMMLKVIGDLGTRWKVAAIDLNKTPPNPYTVFHDMPWLWSWMTEATTSRLPTGSYVVSPFPKAEDKLKVHGLPRTGTPSPLFSLGGYWEVDKKYTVALTPGAAWSPYHPAR